jgi:hypothetical protein
VTGNKNCAIINDTKKKTTVAGVPSWMLVLMNKMRKQERNLLEIGQILEVYFHGGVNFT